MAGSILRQPDSSTRLQQPDKPYFHREWLQREFTERWRTADAIATECGCGKATISRWLRKFGLQRGGVRWPNKPYWNREWLQREYTEGKRTARDIATQCGCRQHLILWWLHKFGIPTHTAAGRMPWQPFNGRTHQPYWNREWLVREYIERQRSTKAIADAHGCTESTVLMWLKRFAIPRRTMQEVRSIKHWGSSGEKNSNWGKFGDRNGNWKGGVTPFREQVYASREWKAVARQVRERDHACRLCGSLGKWHIHHITEFSRAPLLACELWNLIRLCRPCHERIHGREPWWRKRFYRITCPS